MPSQQPNENMDKVLKAYAQKRRDAAGQMEMDLPTRNMLQAEVARTLAPVPVPANARPRFAWWPQIIMGVAACAAVAIALILWVPQQSPSRAKMAPVSSSDASGVAAPLATPLADTTLKAAAPAATPSISAGPTPAVPGSAGGVDATSSPGATFTVSASGYLAQAEVPKEQPMAYGWAKNGVEINSAPHSLGVKTEGERSETDLTLNYRVDKDWGVVVQNGGVAIDSFDSFKYWDDVSNAGFLASREPSSVLAKNFDRTPTTPAPTPAVTATRETVASSAAQRAEEARVVGGELALSDRMRQVPQQNLRFFRIDNRSQYRRNLNSPPLPKVLTNFALQRNGSNVSVRDADGSLYNGNTIANAELPDLTGTAKANRSHGIAPAFQNGNNMPEDTFAFSVSGYNKKLKQKIVFTGNVTNVIMVTNGLPSDSLQQNASQNVSASQNANAPQQQSAQQNLFLNGRVQIGRSTEFDIEAAPTK